MEPFNSLLFTYSKLQLITRCVCDCDNMKTSMFTLATFMSFCSYLQHLKDDGGHTTKKKWTPSTQLQAQHVHINEMEANRITRKEINENTHIGLMLSLWRWMARIRAFDQLIFSQFPSSDRVYAQFSPWLFQVLFNSCPQRLIRCLFFCPYLNRRPIPWLIYLPDPNCEAIAGKVYGIIEPAQENNLFNFINCSNSSEWSVTGISIVIYL